MQPPYNRDYDTDNVPDNEQDFHELPSNRPSFWVVEKFEQGKSAGYFDGGDALHGFTGIIDCALQFRRKQDAERVSSFLSGNVKATEHVYMGGKEEA